MGNILLNSLQFKITPAAFFLLALFFLAIDVESYAQDVTLPLPAYTDQQLDQMLSPIALYPDPLIAQILMASTYPLEVVEASRWLKNPQNSQLQRDQLVSALIKEPWDPSIKSLINFPQIIAMMDSHLQWTEQLGDAFLAEQDAVMNSIQKLREMAQSSGHLVSTPQQTVAVQDQDILIEAANPDVIYVPTYNPLVVYGTWPYPHYQPYYFLPQSEYYNNTTDLFGFGVGVILVDQLWGWNQWDWHHHHIEINNERFAILNRGHQPEQPGNWQHDPSHRHGVPYSNQAVRSKFQSQEQKSRQNFRGYTSPTTSQGSNTIHPLETIKTPSVLSHQDQGLTPYTPRQQFRPVLKTEGILATRPILSRSEHTPPVFESFSHGNTVRSESQRGASSRSTLPQPSIPPARSATSGRTNSGGGHSQTTRTR